MTPVKLNRQTFGSATACWISGSAATTPIGEIMSMNFTQVLAAIRKQKAMQSQNPSQNKALECESVVRCLACREQMQDTIERCHRGFIEVAPMFSLDKSFYDGRYVLSSAIDEGLVDANGRQGHFFSRITFLLAPRLADELFEVECKLTVRSREMSAAQCVVRFADREIQEFHRFVQDQFCRFAETYFAKDGSRPAPRTDAADPTDQDPEIRVWT